jgi:hypothetical protein
LLVSVLQRSLLGKLLPTTSTTCETLVDMDELQLKSSTCVITAAGLLTLRRQINFDRTLENSHVAIELRQ